MMRLVQAKLAEVKVRVGALVLVVGGLSSMVVPPEFWMTRWNLPEVVVALVGFIMLPTCTLICASF